MDQLSVIFSWSVAHEQVENGGVVNDWSNHEMMELKIMRGFQISLLWAFCLLVSKKSG